MRLPLCRTRLTNIRPHRLHIKCDPLSENLAHLAFKKNQDKTRNWYIEVQLSGSEKMEVIGCLVPELWSEKHRGCGMQNFSRKHNVFILLR